MFLSISRFLSFFHHGVKTLPVWTDFCFLCGPRPPSLPQHLISLRVASRHFLSSPSSSFDSPLCCSVIVYAFPLSDTLYILSHSLRSFLSFVIIDAFTELASDVVSVEIWWLVFGRNGRKDAVVVDLNHCCWNCSIVTTSISADVMSQKESHRRVI